MARLVDGQQGMESHIRQRRIGGMEDRNRWIRIIKELRIDHRVSVLDAERIALANSRWRRWVEHQINIDARCHRMALSHILYNGANALIEREGERLKVR